MSISARDRQLGMDRPISRRDFLNGMALSVGAAALGPMSAAHAATPAGNPATLTGLRGHSEQAMAIMHAVRDGNFWNSAPAITQTGETYDLVVVGGGISGLAAAYFYRQQKPDAKILILENNDDFGGHARRNEFTTAAGKRLIAYGGSQSLEKPSRFSPLVTRLIGELGIDLTKFDDTYYDQNWWDDHGLVDAHFFRKEDWGVDALVAEGDSAADWVPQTPLSEAAKANLIELIDAPPDYLAGKTRDEKLELLSRTTYADFLTGICKYDPQLVTLYKDSTEEYFGIGIEGTTALDAWAIELPGFDGMDLGDVPYKTMSPSGRLEKIADDDYIYHFPDGNASIARALVRALIPAAHPGSSMEELVLNEVDYTRLDLADAPVRLRLEASVVRVKHDGDPASATSVTLTYVEDGALKSVTAAQVVLACWSRVIPRITDELSAAQVDALNDQVKVPLVYGTVQLRNWQAFDKLKIDGFFAPNNFWRGVWIDDPVSIGDYKFTSDPSEPMLLHLWAMPVPGTSGVSARDQAAAGRQVLAALSFEEMERELRDLMNRALKDGGFDAARDIEAITVNRWSHGYALEYMRPWDGYWPDGPLPIEAARTGWGRIAIANSDAGAYAYVHSAIDQAGRAVNELVGGVEGFATFPGPALGSDEVVG